jgi:hypothetical protein
MYRGKREWANIRAEVLSIQVPKSIDTNRVHHRAQTMATLIMTLKKSRPILKVRFYKQDDQGNNSRLTDDFNALTSQTLHADGTPKRPMNAFMIFARRRRPQVSSENQSMRMGEISKILSKEWNSMQPVNIHSCGYNALSDRFPARQTVLSGPS